MFDSSSTEPTPKRNRECSPIPAVSDAALRPCYESPGVEHLVAEMVSNTRAYHVRAALERRGYRCRCKKIREGCHAVYAVWPGEDAKQGA